MTELFDNPNFNAALAAALDVVIEADTMSLVMTDYDPEMSKAALDATVENMRKQAIAELSDLPDDVRSSPEILKLASDLGSATSFDKINSLRLALPDIVAKAADNARIQRYMNDLQVRADAQEQKLLDDIKRDLARYLTEEEKKQREEMEYRCAHAGTQKEKEAAENNLYKFDMHKAKEMQKSGDAEEREAGKRVQSNLEKLQQRRRENQSGKRLAVNHASYAGLEEEGLYVAIESSGTVKNTPVPHLSLDKLDDGVPEGGGAAMSDVEQEAAHTALPGLEDESEAPVTAPDTKKATKHTSLASLDEDVSEGDLFSFKSIPKVKDAQASKDRSMS